MIQFIKFGIVGVSNTLISYLINIVILYFLQPWEISWDYYIGNTVAFFLSVIWSFYWNNKYVFDEPKDKQRVWWKVLLKTYAVYAITGLLISNLLSWIWIDIIGISKYIAPIVNLIITVPINYILNRNWAFD